MKCRMCHTYLTKGLHEKMLCELHEKYRRGITAPYFDNLYDLIWWRETFLKKWNALLLPTLNPVVSERLESLMMQSGLMEKIGMKVRQDLKDQGVSISMYAPLNTKIANHFSQRTNFEFHELYNQGFLYMVQLIGQVSKRTNPKMISAWIKKSLWGKIRNFVNRKNWQEHMEAQMVDTFDRADDGLDPELSALRTESLDGLKDRLAVLSKRCTPRQRVILSNMLQGNTNQPKLAKKLKVSQSTVSREIKAIMKMGREIGHG